METGNASSAATRAVLWDNDGVLVDTERLYYEVNREVLAAQGFELSPADYLQWFLRDNCGAWHLLRDAGHSEEAIAALRATRDRQFFDRLVTHDNLMIEGIDVVIRALAAEVPLALVTSSLREHLEAAHRRTDLLRHFRVIVTAEDCATTKPSPEPYLLAARRLGVATRHCVAVEDSPRGIAAATAAGVRCVAVPNDLTTAELLVGADAVVGDRTTLLDVLRREITCLGDDRPSSPRTVR